ncbi:MAG: hypothetical protein H0U53_06875, partial [Actinobacteria bacterium]|nr:hypothetical protein [Actinomycetota bacterium]
LGRIERLERRIGIADDAGAPVPAPEVQVAQRVEAPARRPISDPAPERSAPTRTTPPAQTTPSAPKTTPLPAAEVLQPEVQPTAQIATPAPSTAPVGFLQIKDTWSAVMADMGHRSKRIQAMCNPSRPVRLEGEVLVVEVQSKFHEGEMAAERNRSVLSDSIFATLGVRVPLSFVARGAAAKADGSPPTRSEGGPAAAAQPASEEESFEDSKPLSEGDHDPIELLKRGLGAEIVEERGAR